jgi:hypothetical protein
VTFQSGALLLMELRIVEKITHQGIRYIAEHHPDWPFGEGRAHRYWPVANATVMETDPFLDFFREHPLASQKQAPDSGSAQ